MNYADLFPGPTKPSSMRVEDPTVYRAVPTTTMTERGQYVAVVIAPSGRQVGIVTLPAEDVISALEKSA